MVYQDHLHSVIQCIFGRVAYNSHQTTFNSFFCMIWLWHQLIWFKEFEFWVVVSKVGKFINLITIDWQLDLSQALGIHQREKGIYTSKEYKTTQGRTSLVTIWHKGENSHIACWVILCSLARKADSWLAKNDKLLTDLITRRCHLKWIQFLYKLQTKTIESK